jgi:hypothetical protein
LAEMRLVAPGAEMPNGRPLSEEECHEGVRKSIIKYLEIAASYEAQAKYQESVPIADVPSEMLNQWSDFVSADTIDQFPDSVYSSTEKAAMRVFQSTWEEVTLETPQVLPPLVELFGTASWEKLRGGAEECLSAFRACEGPAGDETPDPLMGG